jgi:nucleoside-diphosphate-sugar epimerase
VNGIHLADLTDRNRDRYRHHFRGVDAVIHCGFTRAEDEDDSEQRFWAEFANVQMAYNVYQVSVEEKVRRVVAASSNHAADYYEPLILQHKMDIVMPEMRALSDNYYGWAKEVYEHLGFVFAVGKVNAAESWNMAASTSQQSVAGIQARPLENIQIRIGGPRETDVANCEPGDLVRMRRALAVYISQRDLVQLFVKSIETEDIGDENRIPFQVFYGISANSQAFWSIANARKIIGYEPQDNSEYRFHELVAEHIRAARAKGAKV